MCDCDLNPPEFFKRSFPTARNPQRCYECLRTIRPGEEYERASGKWDGDFSSYATCLDCMDAWNIVAPDSCRCFGQLIEEVRNGPWDDHRHGGQRLPFELIRVVERYEAYWRRKKQSERRAT